MDTNDDWNITPGSVPERRVAGQGAREIESQHGGTKSAMRRLAERALDVGTGDDRSWRRGAEGEELVGRKLEKLGAPDWKVVHDITIGSRGANLDHLLVGPGGIYSVNTKKLNGKIKITKDGVFQNGRSHGMLEKSRGEVAKVQERLQAHARFTMKVMPMLVIVQGLRQPEPVRKGAPDGMVVLFSEGLRLWFFKQRKAALLTRPQIELVVGAARSPATWS